MCRLTPIETMRAAATLPLSNWQARYPEFRGAVRTCTYVPDELLHAAGFTPVRLRRPGQPAAKAESRLQSYTCSLCRSMLDGILAGEIDAFAGIAFAHSCDTMQAMADMCRLSLRSETWVETVMLPTNLHSAASAQYLLSEMARVRERLAELANRPIRDEDLDASIGLYDGTRRLVQAMEPHRARLRAADYYTILNAAQSMPRERFNPLLSELLEGIATWEPVQGGPRVYLTGTALDSSLILDLLDALGARVSGDDLCIGTRPFLGEVGRGEDPLRRLVVHALQRPPCPCKRHQAHDAAEWLIERVRCTQADGVLFLLEKYCEPHAFDQGRLRAALDRASIPHQTLELEQQSSVEGLHTRVEAFLEML